MAVDQKGFSLALGILIAVTILVLGFVAWRVSQADQKVPNDTTQLQDSANAPDSSIYRIKELGVGLTLPSSLSDLTYATNTGSLENSSFVSATFSTKKITALDSGCSAQGGAPLGDLTRVEGQYPSNPTATNSGGILVKQFPSFYIARHSLQAQCSENAEIEAAAQVVYAVFIEAMGSLKEIE